MDTYAENNRGFRVLDGISPFEEGYQPQSAGGFAAELYQGAAEPVYYEGTDRGESLPAEQFQENVMGNAYCGSMDGAGGFPEGQCQGAGMGYGQGVYMEQPNALPVEPGQVSGTGNPELYQGMIPGMEEEDPALAEAEDDWAQEEMEDELEQDEIPETEETGRTAGLGSAAAKASQSAAKEDSEETERAAHEEAEARRKAEWEEKQRAKKAAEQEKLDQLAGMSDDAAVSEAMKRVGADTEKLTRRNMKDCVNEYIQTKCLEEPGFARMVMHPRKSMLNCFRYINRKAREYIQQEMEDNGIKQEDGVYGGDVPDDLCYQWAEDYFRDPDAKEDQKKEEEFVPKPYVSKGSSKQKPKKGAEKKDAAKKPAGRKAEKPKQETDGQMSFGDFAPQEVEV